MTDTLHLLLNDVELVETEVPQSLAELGGTQALQVIDFPGGTRTIQTLGAFPAPLSWKGVLLGPQAFDRAAQLDRLRVAGSEVAVSFGPWKYAGVINKFIFSVQSQWQVDYTINIIVRQDFSGNSTTPSSNQTPEATIQQLQSDLAQYPAAGVTESSAISAALGGFSSAVSGALQAVGGLVAGVPATAIPAINTLATSALGALTALTGSSSGLDVAQGAVLSTAVTGIMQTLASGAQVTAQITTINPNLMTVAATYYGDASRWQEIAQASGLTDPQAVGVTNLIIPQSQP